MTEINPINQNRVNFKGTTQMNKDNNKPDALEDFAQQAVLNLGVRAEREVPDYGDFAPVVERFVNHNPEIYANEFLLQVVPLPKSLKNEPDYNELRYLQAVVKSPLEQPNRSVLACGTKKEILDALNQDGMVDKLAQKFDELAEDLRMN